MKVFYKLKRIINECEFFREHRGNIIPIEETTWPRAWEERERDILTIQSRSH